MSTPEARPADIDHAHSALTTPPLKSLSNRPGRVYLVGAGPGDPGLLTARALELIAAADVILYDRLIPGAALDGARADAEVLFVGKEGGGPSVPQEQTEALILDRAQAGKTVVRLKGGDPFVFGRGGEEALALRDAEIPFEIVPGVTSGVAAAAYAGIPVTHRGLATAVALVTGHTREDGARGVGAWTGRRSRRSRGRSCSTWACASCRRSPKSLIAAGRPADEPVAIVERGTLPDQRTVTGTLQSIAEIARREQVRAPSITVVGPVAGLAGQLEWLSPTPAQWPNRGRHTRSRAGQRLGASAGGAGSKRRAGAGDPNTTASRTTARSEAIRPRLLHQSQRGERAVRAPRSGDYACRRA